MTKPIDIAIEFSQRCQFSVSVPIKELIKFKCHYSPIKDTQDQSCTKADWGRCPYNKEKGKATIGPLQIIDKTKVTKLEGHDTIEE